MQYNITANGPENDIVQMNCTQCRWSGTVGKPCVHTIYGSFATDKKTALCYWLHTRTRTTNVSHIDNILLLHRRT